VASVEELLREAALGRVGVDRRLVRAVLEAQDVPGVLRFARKPHDDHRIDIDPLLIDLFRHFQSPEAMDVYLDVIRRSPDDVSDDLIQAILPFGAAAVDPLLKLYEELGEELGADVAFLLAGLRVRDERVLSMLLDRLEYDTADGAFALGLYGDHAARAALEKMLAERKGCKQHEDLVVTSCWREEKTKAQQPSKEHYASWSCLFHQEAGPCRCILVRQVLSVHSQRTRSIWYSRALWPGSPAVLLLLWATLSHAA